MREKVSSSESTMFVVRAHRTRFSIHGGICAVMEFWETEAAFISWLSFLSYLNSGG